MQQAMCWWKAVIERLGRWHREVGGEVVLLKVQPWLLVQNRYSSPLSILFRLALFKQTSNLALQQVLG